MHTLLRISLILLLLAGLSACGDDPTQAGTIVVTFPTPVSVLVGPSVHCVVFDVNITEIGGTGGGLTWLDTTVATGAGTVLVTNRRPNVDFAFPDREVPANGTLVAEAGACWAPQPAGTALSVTVEVQVDPGERRGFLTSPVAPPPS